MCTRDTIFCIRKRVLLWKDKTISLIYKFNYKIKIRKANISINVPDSSLDDRRQISGSTFQQFGASLNWYWLHWEIDQSTGDRCLCAKWNPSNQVQTNQCTNECSLFRIFAYPVTWIRPLSFSTMKTRPTQIAPIITTVAFIMRLAPTLEIGLRIHGLIMSS